MKWAGIDDNGVVALRRHRHRPSWLSPEIHDAGAQRPPPVAGERLMLTGFIVASFNR